MRVAAASTLALIAASLVGVQAAQAQATDKPRQTTPAKAQGAAKSGTAQAHAPARPAAPSAGKAKVEGVSTMRTTPAEVKKEGGCHYGDANDA